MHTRERERDRGRGVWGLECEIKDIKQREEIREGEFIAGRLGIEC